MKKLSLIVSVVLCLAMMLTFASCGKEKSPEELLVGEWKGEIEMGEFMAESMGDTNGEYFKDLEFAIVMDLELTDSGKYAVSIDEDELEDAIVDLKKDLKVGMKAMLEDMAEEFGGSVDDIASASGYDTLDEFLDASLEEISVEAMTAEFEDISGKYEIKDGKLSFVSDDEEEDDELVIFEVDEDTLKLDMSDEDKEKAEEDEETAAFLQFLPLTFKRQ